MHGASTYGGVQPWAGNNVEGNIAPLPSTNSKSDIFKLKMSLFCDFFPLWGNIDPYIFRGHPQREASSFTSTFTAKANQIYILFPNIALKKCGSCSHPPPLD